MLLIKPHYFANGFDFWSSAGPGISSPILFAVFAISTITSEYAYGTIQLSLLAVPNRLKFFLGKVGFVVVFTAALTLIGALISCPLNTLFCHILNVHVVFTPNGFLLKVLILFCICTTRGVYVESGLYYQEFCRSNCYLCIGVLLSYQYLWYLRADYY
jgi:ABC-type transport system involved in multi-copper enzyme maturation permease subunit